MECIFCKIVRGEVSAFKVYENESVLAFLDINPRSYGHTLVIPKKHYETLDLLPDEETAMLFAAVKNIAAMLLKKLGACGFNLVVNNGKAAGQVIPHVHVHIIPRYGTESVAIESAFPVLAEVKDKLSEVHKKIIGEEDDCNYPCSQ